MEEIKEEITKLRFTETEKECARISNHLLKKFTRGQITLEDFEKEVAYWYVTDYLKKLTYKPLPSKSMDVINFEKTYQQMKEEKRRRKQDFDEELFFESQMSKEVANYYSRRERILNINRSNYLWLMEIQKIIPVEDGLNHKMLDIKINEFREFLNVDI